MPHTLSIDVLQKSGACQRESVLLRQIYPSGTIVFDVAYLSQLQDSGINLIWATALLTTQPLIELALAWYDRGLNGLDPAWKINLRSTLASPNVDAASTQLQQRLVDRRSAADDDESALCTAGVGYAAAALAGKLAEQPYSPERGQAAMAVLSQWAARSSAHLESVTMDSVLASFGSDVFGKLVQYGATI
jgi:hypothetical protein